MNSSTLTYILFSQKCVVLLEKLRFRNGIKENEKQLKPKYSRAPIEVLITPDGKVVSTSLDDHPKIESREVNPQREDQDQAVDTSLPSKNHQSVMADDILMEKGNHYQCQIPSVPVEAREINPMYGNSTPLWQVVKRKLACMGLLRKNAHKSTTSTDFPVTFVRKDLQEKIITMTT